MHNIGMEKALLLEYIRGKKNILIRITFAVSIINLDRNVLR